MQLFFRVTLVQAMIATAVVLFSLQVVSGQVRSSSNYQLQSDSINIGGGLSSSTNYVQESTVGEIATGNSTSTNYQLRAGYQQMQEVFISLAGAADIIMDTAIGGISGGISNGTSSLVVTTDSPSGYSLSIKASASPAMQSGVGTIADYPATSTPDYTFSVAAGEAYFGYSVQSPDVVTRFRDNGSSVCNAGVQNNSGFCWRGLSTSEVVMAQSTSANHPDGATTSVLFRVGVGNGAGVLAGVYTATTTVTAIPL